MKLHTTTWVASSALIILAFLFVMTASQGKYWGTNEMETYIIRITEGTDEAYLDYSTPTAMAVKVLNQGDINPHMRIAGVTYKQECPVVESRYVINNGRKVAKVIVEDCTAVKDSTQKETRHDTTYS